MFNGAAGNYRIDLTTAWLSFIVSYIGLENMKWVFMAHLISALELWPFLSGMSTWEPREILSNSISK